MTNVRAEDMQQTDHFNGSNETSSRFSQSDQQDSAELPGLVHHTALKNISHASDISDASRIRIGTKKEPFNGVVEWVASRDATEHSRQPLLMSTETGVPLYFEVPPLLRWLEGRGLNLPPEMARHYYKMFKCGGCGDLQQLFRLSESDLRQRFPQLQDNQESMLQLIAKNLSLPPRLIGYSTDPAIYTTNAPIQVNYPRMRQGAVLSFRGLLPQGLVLDQDSGTISGIPTMQVKEVAFKIVATNPRGSSSYDLAISVIDEEPS